MTATLTIVLFSTWLAASLLQPDLAD
ncbi:hypothetical protein WH5701_11189 [Synechococcus sp. WH 5701]|nr:hypothetical protein WH5701_11189 [Synechococcus sp. WH 5701]